MPKNLFNDDGENDNIFGNAEDNSKKPSTFKVNKDFAEKYDQVKRRQELQRLESKLGKNADEDEDEEDDEEEYQGPEDDDAELITDEHETEFANLLLKLRQNDPELKNPEVQFFSEIDEEKIRAAKQQQQQQQKKFTLKDEYQRTIQLDPSKVEDETSGKNNSEADLRRLKARTSEEKKAKMAFLEADAAVDDKAVTSFTVKKNENNENDDDVDEDERRARKLQKKKKKALEKAFAIEDQDDPEEQFLKLYFRDEKWKDGGDDENKNKKDASGNKLSLADWEERMKEEQDEQFYEDAEVWEQEYQQALYRHQEGEEALKVQTFPRQQEEGLLRQKDTARAEARQRKAEREKEQETKLESEVKRLKHLKRQEIESQRERIAKVAGISEAKMKQLAKLLDEELTGGSEFDPSSFDKIMGNLFNEDYYEDVDEEEIHLMEQELEDAYDEEDDEDLPSSDDDDDNEDAAAGSKKSTKKNKEADQNEEDDDDDLLYPTRFAEKHMEELAEKAREEKKSTNKKKSKTVFDSDEDLDGEGGDKTFSSAADVKKRLKKQLDKKVDEYWKLHYEDVLADGTKTRFKYHEVPRETFGLSDEAVLMTDDRTLNMIAPMNCYAPYLTAEQNKKDRFKSMHRAENMRFLDPNRKTRRYKTNTVAINPDEVDEEGAKKIVEAAHKAAEEAAKENEKNALVAAAANNTNKTEKTEQKKHHHQNQNQNNNNTQKPKFNNNQGNNNNNHQHQKQNFNNNDKKKFHNKNSNNTQQQQQNRESGKRRQRDE